MSKSEFNNMMGVPKSDEEAFIEGVAKITNFLANFDLDAALRRPEVNNLLRSRELRDAVRAADIPQISAIYEQIYQDMRDRKIIASAAVFGEFIGYVIFYGPLIFLVCLFGEL